MASLLEAIDFDQLCHVERQLSKVMGATGGDVAGMVSGFSRQKAGLTTQVLPAT